MKADKQCHVDNMVDSILFRTRNDYLRDPSLSMKAMGLLSYMLSCSDEWDYSIAGLESRVKDGKSAIRSTLIELEEAGYIKREQIRGEKGYYTDIKYHIRPAPIYLEDNTRSEPKCENRISDNHICDNRTQRVNNRKGLTIESTTSDITKAETLNEPVSFFCDPEKNDPLDYSQEEQPMDFNKIIEPVESKPRVTNKIIENDSGYMSLDETYKSLDESFQSEQPRIDAYREKERHILEQHLCNCDGYAEREDWVRRAARLLGNEHLFDRSQTLGEVLLSKEFREAMEQDKQDDLFL